VGAGGEPACSSKRGELTTGAKFHELPHPAFADFVDHHKISVFAIVHTGLVTAAFIPIFSRPLGKQWTLHPESRKLIL
jgi:hypothetical protein